MEDEYSIDIEENYYDENEFFEEQVSSSPTLTSFISKVVSNSNIEYRNWNRGSLKETDPASHGYLRKYYTYGLRYNADIVDRKITERAPWSAAFISYIIKKSGGVPPFRVSGGHYVYASKGKKNFQQKKLEHPLSMWLYPVRDIKPKVGDILFNARIDEKKPHRNGANFRNIDNGNGWATHSDLIIGKEHNSITVIGGNKSNSVMKKTIRLDNNGFVRLKGIRLKEYFGILRFFDPNSSSPPQSGIGENLLDKLKDIGLTILDYSKLSFSLFNALSKGLSENKITDLIFHQKYPSQQGQKLKKGDPLVKEWLNIRALFVRPLIKSFNNNQNLTGIKKPIISSHTSAPINNNGNQPSSQAGLSLSGNLGRLVIDTSIPELRKSLPEYQFTKEDSLWMARFVKGEAGAKNDANGHAVLWAMFNRFGMLRHRVSSWTSFHRFLQKYSTTLQPILRSKGAAIRVWRNYKKNPQKYPIIRGVGTYKNSNIQKVQYQKHIDLQKLKWEQIPLSIRTMVLNMLNGNIPNPGIGIATEFASTRIYFRQRYRREPTESEWLSYTKSYAKSRCKKDIKGCTWIGQKSNLNQRKNAFFIDNRFKNVPYNAVQIIK